MARKQVERRRAALEWVVGHLPDTSRFTTHDVMLQADILDGTTWPPYYRQAFRRITRDGAVSLGGTLSRHPSFGKHPDGIVETSRRGSRIRSQSWFKR